MKLFKKITAILLCVVMAVSVASCGADTSWVVKTEKTTITAGQYMYYLLGSYSNAYYMVEDNTKSILGQTIDGVKAEEWIKNAALENSKIGIVVREMFEEKGLTISEEIEQTAKQYADYYWAYNSSVYTANGVAYQTLYDSLCTEFMISALFENIYGKGGEKEITADEMKQGLVENFAKINEIGISLAGISGEMRSEAVQATLKEMAEGYKTRIEAGEKVEDLIKEHYDVEVALAAEESSKTVEEFLGGVTNEIDTSYIVVSENSTNYSEKELEEIFKLENGNVVVVVEKEYVRVIQRFDILEDETYLEQYDYDVRTLLKGEEFSKELDEIAANLVVEINNEALKKYKPSKVKL